MRRIRAFLADESGATAIGYGLVSCVVSVPVAGALALAAGAYGELLLGVARLIGGAGAG